MNSVPERDDWLDAVQARRLSPEQAQQLRRELARRPAECRRLDDELSLNALLDALPTAPVSSNFLAQVEARIAREERAGGRTPGTVWRWLGNLHWARPIAAVAVAAIVMVGWWQFRVHQRTALASNLAAVSQTAGMPGVESLRDFDAVQLLRTTALPGDVELLALLDSDPGANTP